MNLENKLTELWNNIDYYNGGSLQLNIHHALEWHIAYITEKQKAIVIISSTIPAELESSKSITIRTSRRLDGRYSTYLILTDVGQEQVFIHMCSDIIDYSACSTTDRDSMQRVIFRFRQWQRLMAYKRATIMSMETRKGLLGELLYLKKVLNKGLDCKDAVDGWVGPNGADQDFVYSDGWHEVKTIGIASREVTISSVEQLGNIDSTGELIIVRIDKCAPKDEEAYSLNNAVNELIDMMKGNSDAIDNFIVKLNNVGYINLPEYDKDKFKFSGIDTYTIRDTFPRVTRDELRSEITNCKYNLSVPAIAQWKNS